MMMIIARQRLRDYCDVTTILLATFGGCSTGTLVNRKKFLVLLTTLTSLCTTTEQVSHSTACNSEKIMQACSSRDPALSRLSEIATTVASGLHSGKRPGRQTSCVNLELGWCCWVVLEPIEFMTAVSGKVRGLKVRVRQKEVYGSSG